MTFLRVPYEHDTAARKMREAGLPESLGARLEAGLEPGFPAGTGSRDRRVPPRGEAPPGKHVGDVARPSETKPAMPFVMKIPMLRDYDDPAAIVGFEVEQMILPTLSGLHVPRFVAAGDFSMQPYIVMELLTGSR